MTQPDNNQSINELREEILDLKARLAESVETLSAIQSGSVDALVINNESGNKVFTLQGADYPYRVLIENMFEGAATVSDNMDIVYSNRRLNEMLEMKFEQIVGKKVASIIHPEDLPLFESIISKGRESTQSGEVRIAGISGKSVPVLLSCTPLNIEGALVCLIFVELTEIKSIQSELKKINENLDSLVIQRTAELERANEAVKESQAVLNTIIESTPDMIAMKDTEGHYFLLNSSFSKALFPDGFKGKTIDDIASPEEAQKVKDIEEKIIKNKETLTFDQIIPIAGELHTFSTVKSPCFDALGNVTGIATISHDITDRKKAEDTVRASEQRLRALITATSDLVFRSNPDFSDIYIIESFDSYSRIETIIRNWQTYIPEEFRPVIISEIEQSIKNKSDFEIEHPSIQPDGNQRWMFSRAVPILDNEGRIIEWFGTSTDITARKNAENALKQSEQRWVTTLSSIGDAVIATDINGMITFLNPMAEMLTGWKQSEALHQPIRDILNLMDETTGNPVESPVWKVLHTGEKYSIGSNTILVRKDGTEIFIDDSASPVCDSEDRLTGMVLIFRDVTESKRAERALRDSERRYTSLFANKLNAMAHCSVITGKGGKPVDFYYIQVNEAFEKIIGIKKADIEGRRAKEIFPDIEDNPFDFVGTLGKVALEKGEIRFEEYFEPAGKYLSVYAYSPLPGEFIEIISDVTERRRTELALKESEQRFSVMFHAAPVAMSLVTIAEAVIYDVNQAWLDFFGFRTKEGVIGKTTVELNIIPIAAQRDYLLKKYNRAGKVRNFEETIRDLTGKLHYVLINMDAVEISNQKFILSAIEDITDRKGAENALRESEQRWITTLSSIGDGVIATDTEGRITFMNRTAENITGWNHREALRKPVNQFLNIIDEKTSLPVDFTKPAEINKSALYDPKILISRRQRKIPVDYNSAPVITSGNYNIGNVFVFRDITERKEAETVIKSYSLKLEKTVEKRTAELKLAKERAESADRMKSSFLLNISHELRTPLNSIIGFSGILLKEIAGPLNEEQKKQIEMVLKSGRHLLSLITDILDISRIEAGDMKPDYELFDITDLVGEVIISAEPQVKSKNLKIIFEKDVSRIQIVSDKKRLRQVLINLIINAIKFTEQGAVTIQCRREEDIIRIEVSDTGIGIKEEDIEKLFNPFVQLENTLVRKFEGSGLGLSISKKLVEMLNGTISVRSVYGEGSTFTITLPFQADFNI